MMAKRPRKIFWSIFALVLLSSPSFVKAAEVIQFPDEDLASESVLPVFDQPITVRNKNVLTAKRLALGPVAGLSLLEPFYNPYSVGLAGSYDFTEESGLDFLALKFMDGLSSNGSGLNPIPGKTVSANLQYAPSPQMMVLANYQYTGYYGKISMSKDFIMHLNLYGMLGGGLIQVGDGMFPILDVGIGQRFFFSKSWAFKADFRFLAYQGPNILSRPLGAETSKQSASTFAQKANYLSLLSFGAIYMF